MSIRVEKRLVTTSDMLSHVREGGLAIVLIDGSKLAESKWYHSLVPGSAPKSGYHGHFVVLCGVDESGATVRFADPSVSRPVCECSTARFDEARAAHGTDNDIVLIDVS
jgi:alkylhydroperoxidase family enzyme